MDATFSVFVRAWWKENPAWPNGLEPEPRADREYLARGVTEEEAMALCKEYNTTHNPGRLSVKAEFEED